jgi:hypothetical protein
MTTFTLQDYTPEEDEAFKKLTEEQQQQEEADNQPRSFWNFRLVDLRTVDGKDADDWIELCEVFYDHNGIPAGFTGANPFGETVEEVKEMLYKMLEATEKPVLTGDDFKGEFKNGYED